MIFNKSIRFLYLLLVIVLGAATFLTQPAQVQAQGDWRTFSADLDGDGLPNVVEDGGWANAAGGLYVTDYLDADSDDDGLTDGQENLYDTNPLDGHSPGIYVEYESQLRTSQYFPWQRYGSRYIALPTEERDTAIVRRGSSFSVGGPVGGQIAISRSLGSLTPLMMAEQDPCSGRWDVRVPADGTVGTYTITMQDDGWSQSLNLCVIFELPTGVSDEFTDAFVYDDSSDWARDTTSIGYYEGDPGTKREYDHNDYAMSSTQGWYSADGNQGVYAAGELWNWNDVDGGGQPWQDDFRQGSWDLDKIAKTGKIVKKDWYETRFVDYWSWPSEPTVIGSPPGAWPSLPPPLGPSAWRA